MILHSTRAPIPTLIALSVIIQSTSGVCQEGRPTPTERGTVQGRDGSAIETERFVVEVPERRSAADSGTVRLAVLRVRSTLESVGPPVFMLAGGPGGASIAMVERHLQGGGRWFVDQLGGDLIAVDQRGVGESRPLLDSDVRWDLPPATPGERGAMLARMTEVARGEAERWRKQGVDLDGYTTVESADDLDAVRRALGYQQIVLWGQSYGSHLAMATLRRHGEHIARAVLIGPEGPDHTFKLPRFGERALQQVAARVAGDPAYEARIPDLIEMTRGVLHRLERAPVTVDIDGTEVGVSAFDVRLELANALGSSRGMAQVPAAVLAMANGDFSEIARRRLHDRREGGVGTAMLWMMDCASGVSAARAERIAEEATATLLGDAINFPFGARMAAAWGAPDLGDAFRGPLRSDVPVLLIVGDLDARTPVDNARALLPDLTNAHLLVVENASHDLNWIQPEIRTVWHDFLLGRPVHGTHVTAPLRPLAPLPEERE